MNPRRLISLKALVLAAALLLAGSVSAQAAVLTVTTTADTNDGACDADCSLREAIAAAQPGDTIEFAAPLFDTAQEIQINGQLVISRNLTVNGKGAHLLTIRQTATDSRVLQITNGNVNLTGMTLTGGNTSSLGGAIFASNFNSSVLMTLTGIHVTGNTAKGSPGIVCGVNCSLNLLGSTVSGNTSTSDGNFHSGGVRVGVGDGQGTLKIINSTISGNRVNGSNNSAGGVMMHTLSSAVIINSTITDNEVPQGDGSNASGVRTVNTNTTVRNSIIAGNRNNTSIADVSAFGSFTSNGNNIIGNTPASIGFTDGVNNDRVGNSSLPFNPLIGALFNNGGSTPTHALLPNSTAINNGNNCVTDLSCASNNPPFALTTDQRGAARNGNVDIGAFEIEADTDGDGVRDLTDNCPTTPNPEKIAFDSDRHGTSEIYVMNPNGSNQTRLTNNSGSNFSPSFSPDGSKIVFGSARDGNSEIYVMNSDGSNQTRLTSNPAVDAFPSFSPDGSKIVFTSHRDGNLEIYVMNSDGSNQTRLTNNSANDDYPSFSPDGTKIVFTSLRDGGNFEIYVMNPDGSNQTRLTNNTGGNSFPSFSPDGSKIVYTSFGKIYVMNSDGSNQTRLTNISGNDISPSFSPDGTKIAFVSTRSSYFEIYVMNSDGSNQTRLTNPGTEDYKPSWGRQADADGDGTGDACELPDDTTPPVITPTVTGTLGNNDWYVSDVQVSWSVVDDESTVSNQTGCDTQTVTADTSGLTFTCQATSAGGSSSQSVTVKRDASAPVITFDSRTAPNSNGWNNTNVSVNWTCSDALSGAASPSVSQNLTSEGANQSATGTCVDNAGNTASDTQTGLKIDKTAPTLAPAVSPNPVLLNGSATASANAADTLSGIASQSCAAPNTSSVGSKTLNCAAADLAGNTANAEANYRVIYNFAGFFQPIQNLPVVNEVKAGQAIPIKFSLHGYQGLAIFAPGYPASSAVLCDANEPGSTIEEISAPGSSGLSYSAGSDQYNYVWKTEKAWKNTCRMLVVRFIDGSEYYAKFRFK
jgi:CSLREA domain-containing protein